MARNPTETKTPTKRPDSEPYAQVVMTTTLVVDLQDVGPGDLVTTDPNTAARLISAGYATPTDSDQEVS